MAASTVLHDSFEARTRMLEARSNLVGTVVIRVCALLDGLKLEVAPPVTASKISWNFIVL